MPSDSHTFCYNGSKPFKLIKWKVKVDSFLISNSIILTYNDESSNKDGKDPTLKYKSSIGGTILKLMASEGDFVKPGDPLLTLEPCSHPVTMKDLCAECGLDLRNLDRSNFEKHTAATSFSMVHVVPELKVSKEQADKLAQADEDYLFKCKKLVLLVDLDQTLIHTTNDNVSLHLKDVTHFQLYGPRSPWYHTKLRPGTQDFLLRMSRYYELHICTFGARPYAHRIARILDPDEKLFSHRILSRDECFDPCSKTGNLKALFPRGDRMVCIIDDREDVWSFAPNVIQVKPYNFFKNTGDINAPFLTKGSDSSDANPASESKDLPNATEPELKSTENTQEATIPSAQTADNALAKSDGTTHEKPSSETLPELNECTVRSSTIDSSDISQPSESVSLTIALDTNASKPANASEEKSPCSSHLQSNESTVTDTCSTRTNESSMNEIAVSAPTVSTDLNECSLSSPANESGDPSPIPVSSEANETSTEALSQETIPAESGERINEGLLVASGDVSTKLSDVTSKTADDTKSKETDTEEVKVESEPTDDYLLYLEDILIRVHKAFYKELKNIKKHNAEVSESNSPDLKLVVPTVRARTLSGVHIVFSCVIPTNCVPEVHPLWVLAESLGACVTRDLEFKDAKTKTTHVVASKRGSAKLKTAVRHSSIRIVSLEWLLCCAERWERVDERLFPLPRDGTPLPGGKRDLQKRGVPVSKRKKLLQSDSLEAEEDAFCERVFAEAGLSLSQDDIADMDREIEEACSGESEEEAGPAGRASGTESSSGESMTSDEYPRGWGRTCSPELPQDESTQASSSSDVDTVGSVDEEMEEAIKREFGES